MKSWTGTSKMNMAKIPKYHHHILKWSKNILPDGNYRYLKVIRALGVIRALLEKAVYQQLS